MTNHVDPRHAAVRDEILRIYAAENSGLTCPWSGRHGRALKKVLATAPSWTIERWHNCVIGRFASEGVNPVDDPIMWIGQLPRWAKGPLNKFGKLPPPCDSINRWAELCKDYWSVEGRVKP